MENIFRNFSITATRRNHALEHATIHVLTARFPDHPVAGHSNPTGFFLVGEMPTEHIREAVDEAVTRLRNGEKDLAIHPGCGTNFMATGGLAAVFAFLGMTGTKSNRDRLERLPLLMLLSTLAYVLGQPLGPAMQRQVTTDANIGDLSVVDVRRVSKKLHRIVTRS